MTPGVVAVLAAGVVNTLYAVRKGHNVFYVLVGTAVLMLFVAAFDAVSDVAGTAVGGTFLLGTLVYRGADFFALISGLLSGPASKTA